MREPVIAVLRSLLRTSPPSGRETLDDFMWATVKAELKAAKMAEYKQGLSDGVVLFGTLALGLYTGNGRPYEGPDLPDEFTAWARDAVARAEEQGGSVR